jgi:N-acetylglucosaminyl-diphospho-decaprenol L-rhamnosyltransferase
MLRIVIVIYKNQEEIPPLIESLKKCIRVPHEIVCVDNSPETDRVGLEEKFKRNARYLIKSSENLGFARAANCGAFFLGGEHDKVSQILFLNPDTVFLDTLTAQKYAEIEKLNGIVGFAVYNDTQKKIRQASARSFPGLLTALSNREGILTKLFPNNPLSRTYLGSDINASQVNSVDWVSGCALMISKRDFVRLGGFDERYFLYVEDVDLCRHAKTIGIPVFWYPSIAITHYTRKSSQKNPLRADFFHHLGMFKYFWKWSGVSKWLLAPWIFGGVFLRLFLRQLQRALRGT